MIALVRPECPNPKALANGNYKDSTNKDALRASTSGKCMYCEAKIEHVGYAHVEHIKPKAKNKFPELEFEWDNLGFSCQVCNTNKGEKYDETTPFINPYSENPSSLIVFLGWIVHPKAGSERGEYTITELELNRIPLIERRRERIEQLEVMIKAAFRAKNKRLQTEAIAHVTMEADKDKEYSSMVQTVLILHGILS